MACASAGIMSSGKRRGEDRKIFLLVVEGLVYAMDVYDFTLPLTSVLSPAERRNVVGTFGLGISFDRIQLRVV
jgi:hypothetical protein